MAGDNFDEFYKDLKETEKKDSTLTPKQQIDRLLRPGSTYRNLNPYEVLQIDPELPLDEVKKKYRRLSILVRKVARNIKVKVIRQYFSLYCFQNLYQAFLFIHRFIQIRIQMIESVPKLHLMLYERQIPC